MGNCLRKYAQDPNQPVGNAQSSKEKLSKDERYGYPITPKAWPFMKVNKKDELLHAYRLNCFYYSVLKAATKKFSCKNLLSEGGFGDVYKGYISYCTMTAARPGGGFAVAVKRLRKTGEQGVHEWLPEVYIFFTHVGDQSFIVISKPPISSWIPSSLRKGVHFVSINRLRLTLPGFNAKLSDFGLAKYGPQGDQSHVSSRILGTKGYFAPEYIGTGHLMLKSDIYSFGVVLLEIFSGYSAVKKYPDVMEGNLVQWAKPYLSNKLHIHTVIDKRLGESFPREEAQEFAETILRCLSSNPEDRPTISEVVADLERLGKFVGRGAIKTNPEQTSLGKKDGTSGKLKLFTITDVSL
ncbi:probable serine/threonine-protein kinase PBL18 [Fagus crenata]